MIHGNGGHAWVIGSFYAGGDTIVAIGNNRARKRVAEDLDGRGYAFRGAAIHPSAIIADGVPIGIGTVVMAGAVIQPRARIGRHVIINTGATVDHDCVIEDYAHIAPGAHLCGSVHVGEGALVGVGVGLEPGCIVPPWHIVKREEYTVCRMK